jgi:hypothetical protein
MEKRAFLDHKTAQCRALAYVNFYPEHADPPEELAEYEGRYADIVSHLIGDGYRSFFIVIAMVILGILTTTIFFGVIFGTVWRHGIIPSGIVYIAWKTSEWKITKPLLCLAIAAFVPLPLARTPRDLREILATFFNRTSGPFWAHRP